MYVAYNDPSMPPYSWTPSKLVVTQSQICEPIISLCAVNLELKLSLFAVLMIQVMTTSH